MLENRETWRREGEKGGAEGEEGGHSVGAPLLGVRGEASDRNPARDGAQPPLTARGPRSAPPPPAAARGGDPQGVLLLGRPSHRAAGSPLARLPGPPTAPRDRKPPGGE